MKNLTSHVKLLPTASFEIYPSNRDESVIYCVIQGFVLNK